MMPFVSTFKGPHPNISNNQIVNVNAFILKIQRELRHPIYARKVSGLSRNRPRTEEFPGTGYQPIRFRQRWPEATVPDV